MYGIAIRTPLLLKKIAFHY